MKPGFYGPKRVMENPSADGLNFIARSHRFYLSRSGLIYCRPWGSTTDGPSEPQAADSLVWPFGAVYEPADFHDSGWRGTLLVWKPDIKKFEPANHDQQALTDLWSEMMDVNGAPEAKRLAMVAAVKWLGTPAFVDDLSQTLPNIIVPQALPAELS